MVIALGFGATANAGGGGVLQQDRCVVELGFMQAHLTIYQPRPRGSEKFCDAVPHTADTVFVLDYLHDSLNRAPLEVRIIRNPTRVGRFAQWGDIQALDELETLTVLHRPAQIRSGGALKFEHKFEAEGQYLLLVTAAHPDQDKRYHAVAPLQVGATSGPYWLAAVALGGLGAAYVWRRRGRAPPTDTGG